MFPTDPALSTYIMKRVIEQGGLQPGGLNFDAKVRAGGQAEQADRRNRRNKYGRVPCASLPCHTRI